LHLVSKRHFRTVPSYL